MMGIVTSFWMINLVMIHNFPPQNFNMKYIIGYATKNMEETYV